MPKKKPTSAQELPSRKDGEGFKLPKPVGYSNLSAALSSSGGAAGAPPSGGSSGGNGDDFFNYDIYRDVDKEHSKDETHLNELATLHYHNEDESLVETILKKKKLLLRDQMEKLASKFKRSFKSM
jgi:hypothetical protein